MAISRWEDEEDEDINREEISRRDKFFPHPLWAHIYPHTWREFLEQDYCAHIIHCSKTQVNKFDSSSNYKEGVPID